jgi:hypothetical protein
VTHDALIDITVCRGVKLPDGIECNIEANSDAVVKELVDYKRIQRFAASAIQR